MGARRRVQGARGRASLVTPARAAVTGGTVVVLLVLASGCSDSSSPESSGSPGSTASATPTTGSSGEPTPTVSGSRPIGPTPVPSVLHPTPSQTITSAGSTLVTHVYVPTKCGVEYLQFEDHWYRTPHPIKNPPEGWTTPTQDGDVRLISKGHVHFEPYGLSDVIDFYRTSRTPPTCP